MVAWRTLIQLDVPERADGHYQLAALLHKRGDAVEARRHVLMALEETPRYRAALRLLLDMNRARASSAAAPAVPETLLPSPPTTKQVPAKL